MSMGDFIGPSGAKRDFAAFDSVENEHPQMVIETIDFPNIFETGSCDELVRFEINERMPVASKAEVIRMAEVMESFTAVFDNKASSFKNAELLIKTRGRLGHG